jgi:dTDP-glucose pyrophosphorylase
MAAGIGSRYGGGIKQLAVAGPSGEIIMDYSIYDAKRAGFDKVVFVIRRDLEKDFRQIIGNRIEKVIETEYVFQELENIPAGYTVPEGRTKPWGTGHAILSCAQAVKEPFAIINADDFYGKGGFKNVHDYLVNEPADPNMEDMCLAGYILKNTLSENGAVSRGICKADDNGYLQDVVETSGIRWDGDIIKSDLHEKLCPDTLVSMNMWGLRASFLEKLGAGFYDFLDGVKNGGNPLKAEYMIPTFIDSLVKDNKAKVKVLPTYDKWFGVTFKEDLPAVQQSVLDLIKQGEYPENLMEAMKK